MTYRLKEEYPVGIQANADTNISPGLRRHMPIGYAELGAQRDPDGLLWTVVCWTVVLVGITISVVML